jgi:hypothetical protein
MENKLTTLNVLEQLVIEHKIKSLQLLIGESSKRYTNIHCDIILKMIEGLKDAEKEQSRIDWKAGYIDCTINWGEFFGNEREDSFPTDDELKVIDKLSHNFITKNNI